MKTNDRPEFQDFYGTSSYHHWSALFPFALTDGAYAVAEQCGAYWLMDLIASYQPFEPLRYHQTFQVWIMELEGEGFYVRCEDGNNHILVEQREPYTDYPDEGVELWYEHGVILLPSEH